MRKLWIIAIGAILILLLGAAVAVMFSNNNSSGDTTACDVLTPSVAQQVLGEGATQAEIPPESASYTLGNLEVTNCAYEVGEDADLRVADLTVRSAQNADGRAENVSSFNNTRDDGVFTTEPVDELGDDAYYIPSSQQLNVLLDSGQHMLIVSVSSDNTPIEELAGAIVDNF